MSAEPQWKMIIAVINMKGPLDGVLSQINTVGSASIQPVEMPWWAAMEIVTE